jgi:adenylate cyclase
MQITWSVAGRGGTSDFDISEVVIGRPNAKRPPDLDLSADVTVSRRHARLWIQDGEIWIEDLGSRTGTFVNNAKIEAMRQVMPEDSIRVGDTILRVSQPGRDSAPAAPVDGELHRDSQMQTLGQADTIGSPPVEIAAVLKAAEPGGEDWREEFGTNTLSLLTTVAAPGQKAAFPSQEWRRLALLFDLPLRFAAEPRLETLLQAVLTHVIELIPGAKRGAVVMLDRESGALQLKAHHPPGKPAISETLARRAIAESRGFIWNRAGSVDISASIMHHQIETGMYAPLLWKNQAWGAVCVDNPGKTASFSEVDLRFLMAVAHYAAAAVANQQLQDELQGKTRIMERLLFNFSPKLRETLVQRARAGRLQPGGERSRVTILFSDIRGFTAASAKLEPEEVLEMLNEYLSPLAEAIFQHDGTIDKFIGDAILAVFGSPEPDAHQHEKAVRAALAMQEAMRKVNARRAAAGQIVCELGIGIHCGDVLHGFMGAAERLEFTVIGDAVNRANRFCAGATGGEILLSPQVHEHAYSVATADKVTINVKHEGEIVAYKVRAAKSAQG